MSWKTVKIEEIASVKGGKRLPTGHDFLNEQTSHLYIRARDIGDNKISIINPVYISDSTFDKIKNYTVISNDLVITIVGANIGDVGFITQTYDGANLTENAARIRVDKRICEPRFLSFQMSSQHVKEKFRLLASGAAQGKLGLYKINMVDVTLPPMAVQQKIASILSAYDDLIENNRRRIQLLEESARQLYKEWFVRLRFPSHEHVKVVDGVPEGWEKKALNTICVEKRDIIAPQKVNATTPYIGLEHMPRRSITLCNWGSAIDIESTKLVFKVDDILFGKIRSYFHKVGIAIVDGITSSDAVVLSPTEDKFRMYLLLHVSSDAFVAISAKTARPGSKMPRADWKFLLTLPVLIPSDSILLLFNSLLCPIVAQLKSLSLTNRKLAQARDLLLPKLMSGEVAV